jgi:hypothetical protein
MNSKRDFCIGFVGKVNKIGLISLFNAYFYQFTCSLYEPF